MTTFAPHCGTLESFVDCIHGGADKDTSRDYLLRASCVACFEAKGKPADVALEMS